jgi:hypothetical protein
MCVCILEGQYYSLEYIYTSVRFLEYYCEQSLVLQIRMYLSRHSGSGSCLLYLRPSGYGCDHIRIHILNIRGKLYDVLLGFYIIC